MIPATYIKLILLFSFTLFGLCSNMIVTAQSDSSDHAYLRIKQENDFFSLGNWTDRYFTNGTRIEFQPLESWKANGLRKLFPVLPGKSYKKIKLNTIFQMSMFTPTDLASKEIVVNDRPYAGLAYLGIGGISNDFQSGSRLTTEYALGMIGPITQQGSLQRQWHQWLINHGRVTEILPQGWNNQLANAIAVNVRTEYERMIFAPAQSIETIGGFEVNFGSISNFIALNANIRIGKFNDYFYNSSGLKMRNKSVNAEKMTRPYFPNNINRNWQYYFYAKPSFRFELNNSLLQGGLFEFSKSPYTLNSDLLSRFYVNVEFGYGLVYKRTGLLYLQQFRSKEFTSGNPSTWGTVYLMFGFGGRK